MKEKNHLLSQRLDEADHTAEHEKNELLTANEKLLRETSKLKQQIDKMTSSQADTQSLRDEIEELRNEVAKVWANFFILHEIFW